jgi:hypothetical protein
LDIIPNVNSCLVEFADDFRKTGTQEIDVVAGEWYDRTDGHLSVIAVAHETNSYKGDIDVSYDGSQIRFGESGTFTVTSIIAPTLITARDDPIDVHDLFQVGMSRYLHACFKLKDNDQNPDGSRLKSEAMALIAKASMIIGRGDHRQGMRVRISR